MKRFNFLLVAVALVLTITAVSCTTMAGTEDGYYDGQARVYPNRVYVEDPYRGTVVLQQDPRTGRYYEVTPYYDNYYGGLYGGGGGYYSRGYRNHAYGYPSRRVGGGYYSNGNTSNNRQKDDRSSEDYKKDRDDARNKVLGNH